MSGVAIIHEVDLSPASAALARLSDGQLEDIVFAIGALVETQTKLRFDQAESPEGAPWAAWSDTYAATRGPQHSLLVSGGDLRESIAAYPAGLEVQVGTNLVYGAIHQFGAADGTLPARPYLGISDANAAEIRDLLITGIEEALA